LKLDELKNQIDNSNSNGAARDNGDTESETEVINHVCNDLIHLRKTTDAIDKKIQFNTNLVSQNIAKIMNLIRDVHEVFYEEELNKTITVTTQNHKQQTQRQQRATEISNSSLILEIVDMVQQRIKKQNNNQEASSYFLNKSSESTNSSDLKLRKDGLIFPSIRNKPSNLNTSFTFDGSVAKDIKVIFSAAYQSNYAAHEYLI
jgi:hypothetical protein